MSLEFNDIVKQGEAKLKSRKVGVWQKRWIIFRRKSSSGLRRIEKYPDVRCAETGIHAKNIDLEKVRSITRTNSDGKKCLIEIQPEEGSQRLILFSEENEAAAWEVALHSECFERPASQETYGQRLSHNINGELFYVNLIPSMAIALTGECLLQVTSDNLILFNISDSSKELMSWPLNCLRRYGGDAHQFMFESGRHCNTGEGLFIFSTVQGERIYQKVHSATTAICEAHRLLQRREGSSPTVSIQNGKRALGQTASCPIATDVPPVPPPRPHPSLSGSGANQPATRTSSLPAGVLSSPTNTTFSDAANNNSLHSPGAFDPDANDPDDVEKYLDANFRRFLATRKDDIEPPPSQRLTKNPAASESV